MSCEGIRGLNRARGIDRHMWLERVSWEVRQSDIPFAEYLPCSQFQAVRGIDKLPTRGAPVNPTVGTTRAVASLRKGRHRRHQITLANRVTLGE